MAKRKKSGLGCGRGLGAPDNVHYEELSEALNNARTSLNAVPKASACTFQIMRLAEANRYIGEAVAHAGSIEGAGGQTNDRLATRLERIINSFDREQQKLLHRCARPGR